MIFPLYLNAFNGFNDLNAFNRLQGFTMIAPQKNNGWRDAYNPLLGECIPLWKGRSERIERRAECLKKSRVEGTATHAEKQELYIF